MSSEFGRGLAYNLGLFVGHEFQFQHFQEMFKRKTHQEESKHVAEEVFDLLDDKEPARDMAVELWFSAAVDHLYELEAPSHYPRGLQKKIKTFQNKCLRWRNSGLSYGPARPTEKDVKWALDEAKGILRSIDRQQGIKVTKADFE